MIDALAVHKDANGEMEVAHLSNLTKDEAIELGSKVGALIGLGIEGEEGFVKGAEAAAGRGGQAAACHGDGRCKTQAITGYRHHELEVREVPMFGTRRVARRTGRRTARRVARRR